jgi:cell division septation protein DedD
MNRGSLLVTMVRAAATALSFLSLPIGSASSQSVDSTFLRIERLAGAGDRAAARALADSLALSLPDGSPHLADALYWRAFTSSNAADAERDYLRLIVEFPLSGRAPGALLALAQLEYARGDRSAARRRFDQLLREYPNGPHVARASYWSGRLAFEEGDRVAACAGFAAARRAVTADDVELANQIDYFVSQCAAPVDTAIAAAGDSSARERSDSSRTGTGRRTEFSIQVAAFGARRDATALATRLRQRGFDVRVVGTSAPFRVRIGRYASRADAQAALGRMRRSRVSGMIVEAEPR